MTDVRGDEIVEFLAHHGKAGVEVRPDCVKLWLTRRRVAKNYDTTSVDVGLHLRNMIETGGLDRGATTGDSSAVRVAGGPLFNRGLPSFDLDAVLSAGYRGSSLRGTQFYRWATRILREHLLPQPTSRVHRGPHVNAFIEVTT